MIVSCKKNPTHFHPFALVALLCWWLVFVVADVVLCLELCRVNWLSSSRSPFVSLCVLLSHQLHFCHVIDPVMRLSPRVRI